MATPPKAFDVWFVAANTVYKQVPYTVVADWTQQGRLAPADMLRPAGSAEAWKRVDAFELLADYITREAPMAIPVAEAVEPTGPTAPAEPAEVDPLPRSRRRANDDDDDVDMIPLIDISMVLLVFFVMIRATGALSPVDVPDMHYAGELSKDTDAVTISVEKLNEEQVYYSVRVGESPPKSNHDLMPTPEAAIAALDEVLGTVSRPPEVRIACRKDLPSERVFELIRELKKRKDKGYINSFCAEVNEAPNK